MGIKQIKTLLGATISSLGLVAGLSGGMVSAQSGYMNTTGPDSTNIIVADTSTEIEVTNSNILGGSNTNDQSSRTGRAEVEHNTTGGSAKSGTAANANTFVAKVAVNNAASNPMELAGDDSSGSSAGTLRITGPDSTNKVISHNEVEVEIVNTNELTITNTNTQTATSGSAEVEGNTTGGSATTGNATNNSTSSLTFTVSN